MEEINKTAENIKRIEAFLKNIKMNFNNHKKQVKNSKHLDEIENSIAFLNDYKEVTDKLIKDIEEYSIKVAGEIIY